MKQIDAINPGGGDDSDELADVKKLVSEDLTGRGLHKLPSEVIQSGKRDAILDKRFDWDKYLSSTVYIPSTDSSVEDSYENDEEPEITKSELQLENLQKIANIFNATLNPEIKKMVQDYEESKLNEEAKKRKEQSEMIDSLEQAVKVLGKVCCPRESSPLAHIALVALSVDFVANLPFVLLSFSSTGCTRQARRIQVCCLYGSSFLS